jgi:hypothetical protein
VRGELTDCSTDRAADADSDRDPRQAAIASRHRLPSRRRRAPLLARESLLPAWGIGAWFGLWAVRARTGSALGFILFYSRKIDPRALTWFTERAVRFVDRAAWINWGEDFVTSNTRVDVFLEYNF